MYGVLFLCKILRKIVNFTAFYVKSQILQHAGKILHLGDKILHKNSIQQPVKFYIPDKIL